MNLGVSEERLNPYSKPFHGTVFSSLFEVGVHAIEIL
jgi:hypothetical protein